jgi:hypothetical protein
MAESAMSPAQQNRTNEDKLVVYYDGDCPACIRDRKTYERLSGTSEEQVCWFDITGQESQLRDLGIDPQKALSELHVRGTSGQIVMPIFC